MDYHIRWTVMYGGRAHGDLSEAEIRAGYLGGDIPAGATVSRPGFEETAVERVFPTLVSDAVLSARIAEQVNACTRQEEVAFREHIQSHLSLMRTVAAGAGILLAIAGGLMVYWLGNSIRDTVAYTAAQVAGGVFNEFSRAAETYKKSKLAEIKKDVQKDVEATARAAVNQVNYEDISTSIRELLTAPATLQREVNATMVPAGVIVPFAGTCKDYGSGPRVMVPRPGWLLCNGAALRSAEEVYQPLYEAIGQAWGDGSSDSDDRTDFNIPDLRGLFLRGVDHGAAKDAEASDRVPILPGGNTGDAVGTYQRDCMQKHTHKDAGHTHGYDGNDNYRDSTVTKGGPDIVRFSLKSPQTASECAKLGDPTNSESGAGEPRSGKETRPVNAYVNWIIKY